MPITGWVVDALLERLLGAHLHDDLKLDRPPHLLPEPLVVSNPIQLDALEDRMNPRIQELASGINKTVFSSKGLK